MSSILLDPRGSSEERRAELAPRLDTLDGAVVGLLGNSKLNAAAVLAAVGDLLKARYSLETVMVRNKPSFSHPVPQPMADELAERCTVLLAGVGD